MTSPLLSRLIPLFGDFAGLLVKDVVSSQLRKGLTQGRMAVAPAQTTPAQGDSPPETATTVTGCPYCECATALAAAHRYLTRAHERPELAPVYRDLAFQQVYAGSTALDQIRLSVNDKTEVLRNEVVALGLALSPSAQTPNYQSCADQAWHSSALALEQAETFERSLSAMDIAVARIDDELNSIGQSMEG